MIGGADNWVEVENFGRAKLSWLQQFLELPNGIPAHDTFGRVFARLDGQQFESCFLAWIEAVRELTSGQIVALDGKTLRRSHDKTRGKGAIQKKIARQIIDQQADYVLAVKENQSHLYRAICVCSRNQLCGRHGGDYHQTVDKGHGRLEIRECWTLTDPEFLVYLRNRSAWAGLRTLVMVKAERRVGDQTSCEVRYYISSLPDQAEPVLDAVRSHWGIKNQVHWILDVAFREDDSRIRKGYGAQNFAIIRHIALNLLKHENTAKCGIKAKRLKAGWDENYLLKVLAGPN